MSTTGAWIKLSYTVAVNAEYNVKVTAKDLNMRSGPGILYSKKGYLKPGTYTIKATNGGWGQAEEQRLLDQALVYDKDLNEQRCL